MNQDLSSFASHRASPVALPLDYPRLVAALSACQASSRTAMVALRIGGPDQPVAAATNALASVIEGNRGWTAAAASLDGRFHGPTPAQVASIRGQRT